MEPIESVRGIGEKLGKALRRKGIKNIEDALYYLPSRYEDRREMRKISDLQVGKMVTTVGEILNVKVSKYLRGRRKILEMTVGDESGVLSVKWFHFNHYMIDSLKKGDSVILSGKVRRYKGSKEMHHPEIEVIDKVDENPLHFGRIVPIYPHIEGMFPKTLRRIMKGVVDTCAALIYDPIPDHILRKQGLPRLSEALRYTHFPHNVDNIDRLNLWRSNAHRRLIFDEFFFLELALALKRNEVLSEKGISFSVSNDFLERFENLLPFALTSAQRRVIREIFGDMESCCPMNRLIQGDVGSGKTVVALAAAMIAIENGYQVAIMVPTELLAEQHFFNIGSLTKTMPFKIALLTSDIRRLQRHILYRRIENGEIHVVIGTHALLQDKVRFSRLGFVIIDEQHKFGVVQRSILRGKAWRPDTLVMTATPIPRTLSMTVYGDLDISMVDELPPGRRPVLTRLFHEKHRDRVYDIVRKEIEKGRQVYVIYPLIEESEKLDLKNATDMCEELKKIFPHFKIQLLHGRMKVEQKEAIMHDFKRGNIDILVSTTVIEVGIDVPNASLMVVEHAERFGLSQLHQMRGRVGRGEYSSHCLLLGQYKKTDQAKRRLTVMEKTTDGFRIADEDLAIRGPGDFFGIRQSGFPEFKIANLMRDVKILGEARKEAFRLVRDNPTLDNPRYSSLRDTLMQRYKGNLKFLEVG